MIASLPSRAELLSWANQLTKINVQKLESLSDGICFCQIFDKIYPKIINLHKLKREAKVSLEKQKNFRLLLNAIDQLGLCVTINIADLANGKVSSILELLQWMFKQYKKPSIPNGKNDGKENNIHEPRIFKSYVGSIVVRQKSVQKQNQKSQRSLSVANTRRSLDPKVLQQENLENCTSKSMIIKSLQKSQGKQPSQNKSMGDMNIVSDKKEKPKSKIKCASWNKEIYQKNHEQKLESLRKQKEQKSQKADLNFQQALLKALNLERQKICQTLIRVTDTVLKNNPELESKMKKALQNQQECEKQRKKAEYIGLSPDSQVRSYLSSYKSTSLRCQNDSLQEISINNSKTTDSDINIELNNQNNTPIDANNRHNSVKKDNDNNKNIFQDKKATVKKSSVKLDRQKQQNPYILSHNVLKQISAQKQKAQLLHNQQKDQNKQENQNLIKKNTVTSFSNQKHLNLEFHVTEKKPDIKSINQQALKKREVKSENFNNFFDENADEVWRKNQSNEVLSSEQVNTQNSHDEERNNPFESQCNTQMKFY